MTAVAVVTTVSMPTAAQVDKQVTSVSLDTNWSSLSTLIGCSFSSQHAPVITLEGTVTLRVVSASAPPTQTETPVTGVRPDTGVTTPQQAARYTQIHKIYTKNTHKCTQIHKIHKYNKYTRTLTSWCFFSRAAAVQQEAPPLSVI